MKYLISFITLTITIFISLTETKRYVGNTEEIHAPSPHRWLPHSKKCKRAISIANKAIIQYNDMFHKHYELKEIEEAERQVIIPFNIRVFFKACTKTCKKYAKNRRIHGRSKKCREYRKTCDHFRATSQRDNFYSKPLILVKNLSKGKRTGKGKQTTKKSTKKPKYVKAIPFSEKSNKQKKSNKNGRKF